MAGARLTEPDDVRALVTWALATFHTVLFVLVVVLFLYSRGALGPALAGLNTLVGLGLFGALWATTYVTTARALRGLDVLDSAEGREVYLVRAFRWGAANGIAFLAVLAVVIVGAVVLTSPSSPLFFVFVAPFALAVAAVVGAVVGTIFGVIDLALFAVARIR